MSNQLTGGVPVLINNDQAKSGNYFGTTDFYPCVFETTITSAQIKAIRATPITIATAPGAGLVIDLESAVLLLKYGGTNAFTNPQNFAIKYVNGSGVAISQAITAAGFIDQTGNMRTSAAPKVDQVATQAQCENQVIVLHNTGASEITGNAANDNVVIVRVSYNIYPTGF